MKYAFTFLVFSCLSVTSHAVVINGTTYGYIWNPYTNTLQYVTVLSSNTLPGGSTQYIQDTLSPNTTTQAYNVQFATITDNATFNSSAVWTNVGVTMWTGVSTVTCQSCAIVFDSSSTLQVDGLLTVSTAVINNVLDVKALSNGSELIFTTAGGGANGNPRLRLIQNVGTNVGGGIFFEVLGSTYAYFKNNGNVNNPWNIGVTTTSSGSVPATDRIRFSATDPAVSINPNNYGVTVNESSMTYNGATSGILGPIFDWKSLDRLKLFNGSLGSDYGIFGSTLNISGTVTLGGGTPYNFLVLSNPSLAVTYTGYWDPLIRNLGLGESRTFGASAESCLAFGSDINGGGTWGPLCDNVGAISIGSSDGSGGIQTKSTGLFSVSIGGGIDDPLPSNVSGDYSANLGAGGDISGDRSAGIKSVISGDDSGGILTTISGGQSLGLGGNISGNGAANVGNGSVITADYGAGLGNGVLISNYQSAGIGRSVRSYVNDEIVVGSAFAMGSTTSFHLQGKASQNIQRNFGGIDASWDDGTDATRKPKLTFVLFDAVSTKTYTTVQTDGTSTYMTIFGSATFTGPLISTSVFYTTTSSRPWVSSCGTSPSIASYSTNQSGTITAGSGALASCTLNFGTPRWINPPACTITSNTSILAQTGTSTTSAFTFGGTSITSDVIMYTCLGSY